MRPVLFYLVMNVAASCIQYLQASIVIVATLAQTLGRLISPEHAKHAKAVTLQTEELGELQLMQEMLKVQQTAIESQDWDASMFQQLNYYAGMLHHNHGWQQKDVDDYVTQLVDSGPEGYYYEPYADDEDND